MNIPKDMRDLTVFLILLAAVATCAESLSYAEPVTLLYAMLLFTVAGMATRGAESWHWLLVTGLGVGLAVTTYTRFGEISYAAIGTIVFIGPTMALGWMKLVRARRAGAAC